MDLIKEINEKYSALEAEVDKKLEQVKREEEKLAKQHEKIAEKSSTTSAPKILSYEEALARNANLLKSLEMAKARLRSRSTFSPMEQLLERAILNYKRDLEMSLTIATRDTHQAQRHQQNGIRVNATNTEDAVSGDERDDEREREHEHEHEHEHTHRQR